jgi:formate hydrogenlyase subunit 3/multisubunit Na+/H+ antiporter MnhD subunit
MSKKKSTHLDEMLEWQEHQYDPVYYTDGKMPPFLKARGKPLWAAIWWFFNAFLIFISYFALTFRAIFFGDEYTGKFFDYEISTPWNMLLITFIFSILILLCIRLGIRYWQMYKKKKSKNYHKKSSEEGQEDSSFHKIL